MKEPAARIARHTADAIYARGEIAFQGDGVADLEANDMVKNYYPGSAG